ncbi:MAG TPA: amidase [Candidatus Acidoferrales bacterium]|nr:amidase [Candidatus Acidoferrales bacterium]
MTDVLSMSGLAQGRLIRQGAISSAELVEAHLERIGCVNPALNAAVEVLGEPARRAARETDARRGSKPLGPFDGVPFSVKDSIEVAGCVCTAGTMGYQNAPPSACDATLVARLRAAGAIPIARTNLPDLLFAFESDNLFRGRTSNPYDLGRTAGGSSGGEAALIAACGSPFGLGSDAAGSVRVPAHFCGIAAIKPTSGRLPRTGHVPPAGGWIETLWQVGPMARCVKDLCALMPVLLAPDGVDHTVVPMPYERGAAVEGLRIAFYTDNGIAPSTVETVEVVQAAARALSQAGVVVEERRPPEVERSYELEMKLLGPDGGDGLRAFLKTIGSTQTHPLLEGWLAKLEPYRTTVGGFGKYWTQLERFRAGMCAFLNDCDAILSPVCANPALPHGTSIEEANFRGFSYTMTYNLTGWPAAVVRCGSTCSGLPIGVQIAAAPWREDIALAIAQRLEEVFGGWQPPPPIFRDASREAPEAVGSCLRATPGAP